MPQFGQTSFERLATCHPDLQMICKEVIEYYDFSVLEGARTTERQKQLFNEGKSKLDGVLKRSKHQVSSDQPLSMAIDIAPYPVSWDAGKKKARFYFLMGMVKATAIRLKERGVITHDVRFGLDWDSDGSFDDQSFDDCPHMELV